MGIMPGIQIGQKLEKSNTGLCFYLIKGTETSYLMGSG